MSQIRLRAALAASTAALGALATPATAQDGFDLGQIILSGGFTPVEAARYGRAAVVVTGEEIAERGISTVQEALRALPGLSVSSSGGDSTQLRIRGSEANHVLVLIDGIPAASGDNDYVFSGLEAGNVARIEVLRGPQSVFYGSSASAGVVNIITRDAEPGASARFALRIGNGEQVGVFAGARGDRGGVALSFQHDNDTGYDYSGSNGERDGTLRRTIGLKADYQATEALRFGVILRRADETSQFDSTSFAATSAAGYVVDNPGTFSVVDEFTGEVFAEFEAMDGRLLHRLSRSVTRNDRAQDFGFGLGAPTRTKTDALKYRLSYGLDGAPVGEGDHLLNLFLEKETATSTSNAGFGRETVSAAVEYRGSFEPGIDVQVGVRRDDNDRYEDITTWNASASWRMANGMRLHASAGTGSADPTYFELSDNFFPAFGAGSNTQYTGNPALQPERNRSFDIGLEMPVLDGRGVIDVTYFNETLEGEITDTFTGFDPVTNTSNFTFLNQAGESTREGIEITGRIAATDRLDLRFGYTYLDAKNPNGSVEIRRPKHELSLGATLQAFGGRGSVSADLRHVAGNFDTQFFGAFQTVELPDVTTVDVALDYRLSDTLTLEARVQNLFDAEQSDVWGYAGQPREITVGLLASF